jgi:hypothetical protein
MLTHSIRAGHGAAAIPSMTMNEHPKIASRPDAGSSWQQRAEAFARDEPAKAVASAFGAGLLLTLLPIGATVRVCAAILFALARPVLLGLGLRKAWELCPIEKPPSTHP